MKNSFKRTKVNNTQDYKAIAEKLLKSSTMKIEEDDIKKQLKLVKSGKDIQKVISYIKNYNSKNIDSELGLPVNIYQRDGKIYVEGKYTSAQINTNNIEETALKQVSIFTNHPAFEGSNISIMPDVHAGKGSVVGFTSTFKDNIISNVIGVDIGCGVTSIKLNTRKKITKDILPELDQQIRRAIPMGFHKHSFKNSEKRDAFVKKVLDVNKIFGLGIEESIIESFVKDTNLLEQLGTLGGGNHFIELDMSKNGDVIATVHSGSRYLGVRIADMYQKKAEEYCKKNRIKIHKDLAYLPLSEGGNEYLKDMKLAVKYARLNRAVMLYNIHFQVGKLIGIEEISPDIYTESIHNYIGDDNIIRKGAISAYNENIIIPLNMRDGVIIGKGKSNETWNFSAPHGAGRKMSRTQAFKELSLDRFKDEMQKAGIYSSSVGEKTLDESFDAYKSHEEIIDKIKEVVEIKEVYKPIYNLKADS